MDLLGGYGSDSDDSADRAPIVNKLPQVSSAPDESAVIPARTRRTHTIGLTSSLPPPSAAATRARPQLTGPLRSLKDQQEDVVGPALPPRAPVAHESEIPATNQDVWGHLPAPQLPAKRKVVTLPLAKALKLAGKEDLLKGGLRDDDDEADRARAKRFRSGAEVTKSKLMDFLPAPKHGGRIDLGGGGGGDGGFVMKRPGSITGGAGRGAGASGSASPAAPAVVSNEAFRVRQGDSDDDDLDPVSVMGPMPEAGAFAAGPVADADGGGDDYGAAAPGPSAPPQAWQGAHGYEAAQYAVPQHYNTAAHGQYGESHGGQYRASHGAQYTPTGDPGQDLLAQALAAEQERAARKGKGGALPAGMAGVQFKEVNAAQLRYMDPAAKEAAANMRSALGSEYASILRTEATPHEGNKMAKRKHQIGTLFYNAKMKELEILEGKATAMRHKSETAKKYGW